MTKLSSTLSSLFKRSKYETSQVNQEAPEGLEEGRDHAVNQQGAASEPTPISGAPAAKVLFTRRAWTALMSEVLKEISTETGGILLGYRNDSEWVVVEAIDPGPNSIFQVAYFEYDQPYVMHQVNRVRYYYDPPLDLLGLWHRHPGSFDQFSRTDDGTNQSFASMSPFGAISGLVNIDPHFRFTLYRVDLSAFGSIKYVRIPYSTLSAEDSEGIAPLRDIDELALTIEQRQAFGRTGAQNVLLQSYTDLAQMADKVGNAIAPYQNERLVEMPADDALPEWSDEQIGTLLEALGTDIAFFANSGIELRMKLLDESRITLSVCFEGQEEPLCVLVLTMAPEGNAIPCIIDINRPSMALPYEPGFFERSLTDNL